MQICGVFVAVLLAFYKVGCLWGSVRKEAISINITMLRSPPGRRQPADFLLSVVERNSGAPQSNSGLRLLVKVCVGICL